MCTSCFGGIGKQELNISSDLQQVEPIYFNFEIP